MAPRWYVYMLRCGDGSLYTGIATDVARRVEEHQRGGARGARYLRGRGPLTLALQWPVGDRGLALRVEARIKRLPRALKEELVSRRSRVRRIVAAAEAGRAAQRDAARSRRSSSPST